MQEIQTLSLDQASFQNTGTRIQGLRRVNFFFGGNGTGKSTIAGAVRALAEVPPAEADADGECRVLVFDERFIEENFTRCDRLEGVYTLDARNAEAQQKLKELQSKYSAILGMYDMTNALYRKRQEDEATAAERYQKAIWKETADLRSEFDKALTGKKRIKAFADAVEGAAVRGVSLDELRTLYQAAYGADGPKLYAPFTAVTNADALEALPGMELLGTPVVNTSGTSFALFMETLAATDWVRQGHSRFSHQADGKCPYCQQLLPENFEAQYKASFDARYEEDLNRLRQLKEIYRDTANRLYVPLSKVPGEILPQVDLARYTEMLRAIKERIQANLAVIDRKLAEPGCTVQLEPVRPLLQSLSELIREYNERIAENNAIVQKGAKKRRECIAMLLSYMKQVCTETTAAYQKEAAKRSEDRRTLEENMELYRSILDSQEKQIVALSEKAVETERAKNEINRLIEAAGLQGFRLESHELPNTYRVVRSDGSIADNLSEGERRYIAFLYFYLLAQGREHMTGPDTGKIVVIDDPVSGMDDDLVFAVGSLVRDLIDKCLRSTEEKNAEHGSTGIRQIFVLTHNAVLYRDVSLRYRMRRDMAAFYTVRKSQNQSSVQPSAEQD